MNKYFSTLLYSLYNTTKRIVLQDLIFAHLYLTDTRKAYPKSKIEEIDALK